MFDTGDSLFNEFPGWFVDDMVVFDQSATIAGTVYYDVSNDGIFDNGEEGLNNWFVTATGPVTITAESNSNGGFNFPLPLGLYSLSETVQPSWVQTTSPASWAVDLTTAGQLEGARNFGNYRPATALTGLSFNDLNQNGILDGAEPGLPDRSIQLFDSGHNLLDETVTDTSGAFGVLVFNPGTYYLRQYLFDRWRSTAPGGDLAEYAIIVSRLDTTLGGFLFGSYYEPLLPDSQSIRGSVYNDLNQNAVQDDREPMLSGWAVVISSPNLYWNVVQTDSAGEFNLQNVPPGPYTVHLERPYRWQQSSPASDYSFDLPSGGVVKDSVIFGVYELPVGSVRGTAFNDLNRNGIRDTLEPALSGWSVLVNGTGNWNGPSEWTIYGNTDSAGNFEVDDVVVGEHQVSVFRPDHWRQSLPPSPYSFSLDALQLKDSLTFGEYALAPGSISGVVFNDLNANAVRDPGEAPISAVELRLGGAGTGSTVTDDSGHYQFNGLWAGFYQARMILNSNWRQTYPPSLQPHYVTLADEDQHSGADFGLTHDSSFNVAFRTFLPESIAYGKDSKGKFGKLEKQKPYASEATFDLATPINGLTGLHVEFSQSIDPGTLTVTRLQRLAETFNSRQWEGSVVPGESMDFNEHVIIYARGNKPKPLYITKYWWMRSTESPAFGTQIFRTTTGPGRLLLHMPNTMNVLDEMYRLSNGNWDSLKVGLGGPHTVIHLKPVDVWKSLYDHHGLHTGPSRCLGVYANSLRPIAKTIKTLPPTKGNNILFAEGLALKVNLKASETWVTPPGLGYLIFQKDSTNVFNGWSVYHIAAKLDTIMSVYLPDVPRCGYTQPYFDDMYRTIRMIDSAFSGPFDTVSWAGGLYMKPVRSISDVPYLRLDSSFARIGSRPAPVNMVELPEQFSLNQNYPNPFNPTTTLSFVIGQSSLVTLKVYNLLGEEIATLLNRELMDEGSQEVDFDASNFPSGVYFYRLRAEGIPQEDGTAPQSYTAVKRMLLLK